VCSRIVGRYWRHGTWNKHPYFVQEVAAEDEPPLMVIHAHRGDDSKWWVVDPGWGKAVTKYVACGRFTEGEVEDEGNLSAVWWYVPWDSKQPSLALRCHHGAAWLHDWHSALMAKEVETMNELLKGHEDVAAKAAEAAASSSTEAVVAIDDADDNVDDHEWKPKAGSLNHKCALIVAIETNNWSRVYHLCHVWLILATHPLFNCFKCGLLGVYDVHICSCNFAWVLSKMFSAL